MKTLGKIILVLFFFIAGIISAMGQNFTVSGTVFESEDGEGMEGIYVTVASGGFTLGDDITDDDGNYEIAVNGGIIGPANEIEVFIMDCDGNDESSFIEFGDIPPDGELLVDFIFCDDDWDFDDCSAEIAVFPSPLAGGAPSDNSFIIFNPAISDFIDGIEFSWTIDGDDETYETDLPFLLYEFDADGLYEICLEMTGEDCNDFNCEYINISIDNSGCTDPTAINYDPTATIDDGSCDYDCSAYFDAYPLGFDYETFFFEVYYPEANMELTWTISGPGYEDIIEDGPLQMDYEFPYSGLYDICLTVVSDDCTDTHCQEIPILIDGSDIEGCTDPLAVNFNPFAMTDDGSCYYSEPAICGPGEQAVTIIINTDEFPEDIEWSVFDPLSGNIYMSYGDLFPSGIDFIYQPHETYYHELCIPDDVEVVFQINDAAGDGICCSSGLGKLYSNCL